MKKMEGSLCKNCINWNKFYVSSECRECLIKTSAKDKPYNFKSIYNINNVKSVYNMNSFS